MTRIPGTYARAALGIVGEGEGRRLLEPYRAQIARAKSDC
jgi:hypothetical protein